MEKEKYRLEIAMPADEIQTGDDTHLTVSLHNLDSKPIWINHRMAINNSSAPAPFRELTLNVYDAKGRPLDFTAKVKIGEASSEDFKTLEPMAKIEKRVQLDQYFSLKTPGRYSIRVTFEDGSANPPSAPKGTVYVKGPVVSKEKSFQIIEAKDAQTK